MKLNLMCFVITFESCFVVIAGIIDGPGVCLNTEGRRMCCPNYQYQDGHCTSVITGPKDGPGVCKDTRGGMRCCTNYHQKDWRCKPCEVGTYGVNCSGGPCKYGYYGFGCRRKCSCTTIQYCDRRTGCENNATHGFSETDETYTNPFVEKMLFVILGVSLGVGFTLTIIFSCKRIKLRRQSGYIDTMFLQHGYDYPLRKRGAELDVTYEGNGTVPNIEDSRKSPEFQKQENEYLEMV